MWWQEICDSKNRIAGGPGQPYNAAMSNINMDRMKNIIVKQKHIVFFILVDLIPLANHGGKLSRVASVFQQECHTYMLLFPGFFWPSYPYPCWKISFCMCESWILGLWPSVGSFCGQFMPRVLFINAMSFLVAYMARCLLVFDLSREVKGISNGSLFKWWLILRKIKPILKEQLQMCACSIFAMALHYPVRVFIKFLKSRWPHVSAQSFDATNCTTIPTFN